MQKISRKRKNDTIVPNLDKETSDDSKTANILGSARTGAEAEKITPQIGPIEPTRPLNKETQRIPRKRKNSAKLSNLDETFDNSIVENIILLPTKSGNHPVVQLRGPFKNYIICKCASKYFRSESAEVTNNDILCSQVPKYINNYVIDMFMSLKSKTEAWNHICFLPCDFTNYILGDLWENMFTLPSHHWLFNHCNQAPDDQVDLVFLPYNSRNHWGLVVLDRNDSTFLHYDSLGFNDADTIKSKFDTFLEHCRKIGKCPLELSSSDWTKIDAYEDYPKQFDGYNCGCYVMFYMHKRACEISLEGLSFDPNSFRKDILEYFLSHPPRDICSYCGKLEKFFTEKGPGTTYLYRIETRDNRRVCTLCDAWAHNTCSIQFFSTNHTCIVCSSSGHENQCLNSKRQKSDSKIEDPSSVKTDLTDVTKSILIPKKLGGFDNPVGTNSC